MSIWMLLFCVAMEGKTKQVTNPISPGPFTMVFEEEIRFGAEEEGDEYYWNDGQKSTDFAVAPNGHMFVIDIRNSRILEFDADGAFVKVFAAKGEGPGEYQNLMEFHINHDGSAVGLDLLQNFSKLSLYDKERNFVKHVQADGVNLYSTVTSPDGKWTYAWFFDFNAAEQKLYFNTGLFDETYTLRKEMSSQEWPRLDPTRAGEPSAWVDYLAKQFDGLMNRGTDFARFHHNGTVLIADSKKYAFDVVSGDLNDTQMTIAKDYKPIPFEEAEKEAIAGFIEDTIFEQSAQLRQIVTKNVINKAMDQANLPLVQNPVSDILTTEEGHTLVLHNVNLATGHFVADMFSPTGKCIGQVESPDGGIYDLFGTRMRFAHGKAYAMIKTEDGDNQMVRYRYRIDKK